MTLSKNDVCIGTIIGAHGVHGAVRMLVHSDDANCLLKYKDLKDSQGRIFKVKKLRILKGQMVVVKFEESQNRTQAEELKSLELYVNRNQLPEPDDNEFYIADLIGLEVRTSKGSVIGKVEAVDNHGAGHFLTLSTEGKECVPFTHEAVPEVHVKEGYIVLNEGFTT